MGAKISIDGNSSNVKATINNWQHRVRLTLQEYPESRDCDYTLYFYLLVKFTSFDPDVATAHDLLKSLSAHTLPSFKYIERIRRRIQEKEESLRGTMYNKRLDNEDEVLKSLGYEPDY